jgi:hypothetical protein
LSKRGAHAPRFGLENIHIDVCGQHRSYSAATAVVSKPGKIRLGFWKPCRNNAES